MTNPKLITTPVGRADDTGDGALMFFVFIAAVLISTAAVAVIALVGTWWMLGVGFAIHVIMTVVVVLTIMHAMAHRARSAPDRDRIPATAPPSRKPSAASQQAGAHAPV